MRLTSIQNVSRGRPYGLVASGSVIALQIMGLNPNQPRMGVGWGEGDQGAHSDGYPGRGRDWRKFCKKDGGRCRDPLGSLHAAGYK